jgi:hypothetical protein
MECRTVRLIVDLLPAGDSELDASDRQEVKDHLASCPECASRALTERQADAQIGQAMRAVIVPEGYRSRLLTRLDQERRDWYRRWPMRHARLSAAAAALFIALVGLGAYWFLRPLPVVLLSDKRDEWDRMVQAPPAQVEEWFAAQGLRTAAPPGWDYANNLRDYSIVELDGKRVPRLLFINAKNDIAFVYILSASQFDLARCGNQTDDGSGRYSVVVLPHPTTSKIAYLVQFTGGSLDAFLAPEAGGGPVGG